MCSEQPQPTDADHSEIGSCEHCTQTIPEDHMFRRGLPPPETGSRANSGSTVTQKTTPLKPLLLDSTSMLLKTLL